MKEFERVEVGYINTPLEKLERLSNHFGCNIYVKRDDMSGLAIGGNKTRKLDYIVKYALDNGYTTLLTIGAPQTNHGRLTIAAAAKFGLKSILVCEGKVQDKAQGNLILDRMMDAEIVFIDNEGYEVEEFAKHKQETIDQIIKEKEALNEKVLYIPLGGSSALGAYGYLKCMEEIVNEIKAKDIKIDYMFSAYGSTGTYAGLFLGAKYFKADFELIGIPVMTTPMSKEGCSNLINELATNCEIDYKCTKEDINIAGGDENNIYAQPNYGISSKESREAMYLMARLEGMILDPVYTGKTAYGMFDHLSKPEFKNKNILFLHTGGAPALFATPYTIDIQDELWNNSDKVKQR